MGLDGVEIVMEVEDSFDIAIPDDEAAAVETVGQLIDLVRSKLPEREATVCHSAVSFYALRRFLTQAAGAKRSEVKREAALLPLLLRRYETVRESWAAAAAHMELRCPSLVMSQLGCTLLVLTALGVLAVLWWVSSADDIAPATALLSVVGAGMGFGVAWLIAQRSRSWLPSTCATVGEAAKAIAAQNFQSLVDSSGGWTAGDVSEGVRQIIASSVGLSVDQVTPDAHLIKDLGLG